MYSPTKCVIFHMLSLASQECAELGDCALPSTPSTSFYRWGYSNKGNLCLQTDLQYSDEMI